MATMTSHITEAALLPRTWYAATIEKREVRVPLQGAIDAETVVVGGGLAGLAIADAMTRRGREVVLLEARRIGFGASGRNGGFVCAGFARGLEQIEKDVGRTHADKLYRLSLEGVEIVRRNCAAFAPGAVLGDGILYVRRRPDEQGVRQHATDMLARFGQKLQRHSTPETRKLANSARYFDSLFDPSGFHIHPLRYVEALGCEIARRGAKIFEGSGAVSIAREGAGFRVTTAKGSVRAKYAVLATSAYDRTIHRGIGAAIQPVATYMIATEPLCEAGLRAIPTLAAIGDDRRASDYYRRLPDGRILWGGRITTRATEPKRLGGLLAGDLASVYPDLGRPRLTHAWSGLMAYARHAMPIIGRMPDGVYVSTAFGGHGLNTTAMAGEIIGAAIAEGDERIALFAAFGPGWAGGLAGRAAVQLKYWGMQLRDRFDERHAASS